MRTARRLKFAKYGVVASHATPTILAVGNEFHVLVIGAAAIPTYMIWLQPVGNETTKMLVNKAMYEAIPSR